MKSSSRVSSALLTDHYELTMVEASLRDETAAHRAVFQVFARSLPPGRRYGVFAGVGRLLEELNDFRFGPEELAWLEAARVVGPQTLAWLAEFRFSGSIRGYREGELYFPNSPVLTVEGPFAEAVVLETLVLSILNYDSAVAAAGSRMVTAAHGRPLIEAGGRRTHERAAPAAARAAYLVGFAATSNLEAGRRWGVPTGGTAAHAFVLAHADERSAFQAQLAAQGPGTTLLVDTFDIDAGIRCAVDAAGPRLGAIRIDSGDLAVESRRARALLDHLGALDTKIVVSGDLDEHRIADLANAPVDRFLVGTKLVTGSGHATAGLVYKLVAAARQPGRDAPVVPVAKRSAGKATPGGVKAAARLVDRGGGIVSELIIGEDEAHRLALGGARPLAVRYVDFGEDLGGVDLPAAREHHRLALAEIGDQGRSLLPGDPVAVAALAP